MSLKLTIDEGNSSAKAALWTDGAISRIFTAPSFAELGLDNIGFDCAIYSSVRVGAATPTGKILKLNSDTPLPFNLKKYPTLGADRIAAAAGAAVAAPGENVLVADIGTAVTYDFVNAAGDYLGGNIAPGISLRLKSLAAFTSALPAVDPVGPVGLLGQSTESAMRGGAVLGVVSEIEYYRRTLADRFGDTAVIITGGGAELVGPLLSSPFIHEPMLVMLGLKRILDYNEAI